jgi:predicted MFS family arabinose efflux permease
VLVALVPLLHQLRLLDFPVLLVIVFFVGGFFAPYSAAQGVLLTDVVGEDERTDSEVGSWLQAATRLTIMIGPALAGVLITVIGAPNLLWIDAGTFLIAFTLVCWFAPRTETAPESLDAVGALAGLRQIVRDRLLRYWGIATCGFEFSWQIIFITIPAYAFVRFHHHPVVGGILLGVFGAASTAGNIASTRLTRRMNPAHLARTAKILQIPVFWVLAFTTSAPAFAGVLAVTGLCNGLLAGPVAGIQLTRTPAALRPKVMTALLSASLLAGSLGTLTAGRSCTPGSPPAS